MYGLGEAGVGQQFQIERKTGSFASVGHRISPARPVRGRNQSLFLVIPEICVGGKVSGNLEILDFDDPDAAKSWSDLLKKEGNSQLLETLPVVMTPTGGFHVYYRCEEPVEGDQKLAQKNGPDGQTEVMSETRGEGGYVVAPGSPRACHSSGRNFWIVYFFRYTYINIVNLWVFKKQMSL